MTAPMIIGNKAKLGPILYRGGALVSDRSNQLRLELLTAATSAYSFNPHSSIDEVGYIR